MRGINGSSPPTFLPPLIRSANQRCGAIAKVAGGRGSRGQTPSALPKKKSRGGYVARQNRTIINFCRLSSLY